MRPIAAVTDASVVTEPLPAPAAVPSPWPVFWVASVAVFLVSLDTTMLYAVFDALRAGFPGATAADLSWVINGYTVVYAAMLIPAGGLSDVHGRKKVFMLGVTLFIAASTACGLASGVGWLIVARVVQAIGAALLTPASLSMVLSAFPQNRRAVAVASWGAVGAVAAALGPSLGSLMADSIGWPWAFYINVPLGAISLWRGATLLKEQKAAPVDGRGARRIDLVGMLLLIVGVGAITLAIVEAESPRWGAREIGAALVTGVVVLAAFVAWAHTARDPLVDLSLFRNRTYGFVNLATFTFGIAFAMMFFGFFFYMRGIWHYNLPMAGLAIMPGPLLVAPVAIVSGRLAARFGHRPLLIGGAVMYALAGTWFLLVPGLEADYLRQWLPGLLCSGIGVGMTLPSLAAAAVNKLPIDQYAVGSAVNQATRQIGTVLGVAITVLLLGHSPLVRGDFTAFYVTQIALALTTALLCVAVHTRPAPPPR